MKHLLLILTFVLCSHAQWRVSTFAGSDSGYVDGKTYEAMFNRPFGMCQDDLGNIYVCDSGNNVIRKVDQERMVTTFIGNGKTGIIDGSALDAEFNSPTGICTDNSGNFLIVDFLNQAIRKIDSRESVTTIAGNGEVGLLDGMGANAKFNYPRGIVIDSKGNLFVSDSWNHRIRKISTNGIVSTFAGGGKSALVNAVGANDDDFGTYKDGPDTTARFHTPCGLAIDSEDNIYVADALNHMIRKITKEGLVSTIAGNGIAGFGEGNALEVSLNTPTELCVARNGEVFISDTYNNVIRKLTLEGNLITIAGNGEKGDLDGLQKDSMIDYPRGIISNTDGTRIIFIDHNNNKLKLIELN